MPITKNHLINDAIISCGMRRETVKVVVEQLLDVIKDSVKEGRALEIRGFGTFIPKACNPRTARNLQTGDAIPMSSRKSVFFKFSSELKAKVRDEKLAPSMKEAASKQVPAHELAEMNSL